MVEPQIGHEAGPSARPTRARRAGPLPAPAALPLPTLGETGARYLDLVGPRLSPEDRARAEAQVAELLRLGAPLQARLRQLAGRNRGDYVGGFWRDMYLERREPLAVDQNVAVLFRLPPALERLDLPDRAAALALTAGAVAHANAAGWLPPDRELGRPLCMAQRRFAFGTTRLPGSDVDRLRRTARPDHFILAHRGRFHPLPLAGESSSARSALAATIRAILADPSPGSRARSGFRRRSRSASRARARDRAGSSAAGSRAPPR